MRKRKLKKYENGNSIEDILLKLKLARTDPSKLTPQEAAEVAQFKRTVAGPLTGVTDALSFGGSTMQTLANIPGEEPKLGQSVLGGALSGVKGGIPGILMGAFGGLTSSMAAANRVPNTTLGDMMKLKSKTIQPKAYQDGTGITGVEDVDIQTEAGEVLALPEGEIVDVLAKKKHKNMKSSELTDKAPRATIVFSDKLTIDTSKLSEDDDVIATYPGTYSEEGNTPLMEMKLTDILGKGKMSFAEAAKKIRNKIKTIEDYKDILNDNANSMNKETRVPYLLKLLELQERKQGDKKPKVVQEFEEGGLVPNQGSILIDDLDSVWDYALNPNGLIQARKKGTTGPYKNLNDVLSKDQFEQARQNLLSYAGQSEGRAEMRDYINNAGWRGGAITQLNNLPTQAPSPLVNTSASANALRTSGAPTASQPLQKIDNMQESPYLDPTSQYLDGLNKEMDNLSDQNQRNYLDNMNTGTGLFNRQRARSTFSLLNNTLSNALQDSTEDSVQVSNTFLSDAYRGTPPAVVDQQAAAIRSNLSSMASELLRNGVPPSQVTSVLADIQNKTVNAESDLRFNFFNQQNTLDKGYFTKLNNNLNTNSEATTKAGNRMRDNQNKLIASQSNAVDKYLSNIGNIDVNQTTYGQNALADLNKNKFDIFGNKLNIYGLASQIQIQKERELQEAKAFSEYLKNRNK